MKVWVQVCVQPDGAPEPSCGSAPEGQMMWLELAKLAALLSGEVAQWPALPEPPAAVAQPAPRHGPGPVVRSVYENEALCRGWVKDKNDSDAWWAPGGPRPDGTGYAGSPGANWTLVCGKTEYWDPDGKMASGTLPEALIAWEAYDRQRMGGPPATYAAHVGLTSMASPSPFRNRPF